MELITAPEKNERSWLPLAVAASIVLAILAVAVVHSLKAGGAKSTATPVDAPLAPYAPSLSISGLAMSESSSLAGGKVTYIDGHLANLGARTVTAVTVQVIFRDFAHEVAQNDTQQLKLIRVREPAVDLEPVSAAPLRPGDERDFRLVFDGVKPDWDGAYPEIRILHVEAN